MSVYPMPPTYGVSEFRTRIRDILNEVKEQPVLLVHRNHPAAVLVDVDTWNHLVERLSELEDIQIAMERLEAAEDDPTLIEDAADIEAEMVTESVGKPIANA